MGLRAAAELLRPANCIMIGFAVLVGFFVSKPPQPNAVQAALGFMTGFLISAYSMCVNDIYDVDVDKVNRPDRPIPSGRISQQSATRVSVAVLVGGVAASVLSLNPVAAAVALVYVFLSWLYSSRAKQTGLPGNLIVASSLAIPFVYGGVVAGGDLTGSLLLMMALTAFFSGVGREVVKAMADVEGDAKRGVNSVARTRGLKTAAYVGAAFFIFAVFNSWVPLLLGLANRFYSFGVAVPDLIFAYLAVSIVRGHEPTNAHRVKSIALAGMAVGLLVFVGGAF